jgi:predicted amidohydrolase YtcJ
VGGLADLTETGWPRPEALVVADAVQTYHSGRLDRLPRGIVVGAGRVLALVDPDDRALRRDLLVRDLSGCVVVPGFIDAHNHQPTAARDIGEVETAHVRSLPELRAVLAAAAGEASPGTWVSTEHCLTVSQLGLGRLPTAAELDGVTPEHPVAVRFGAHTMVLNSLGLARSGIPADPPGGVVDHVDGRPTGTIREYGATRYVLDLLRPRDPAQLVPAMREVQRRYAAQGITGVRVTGLRPGELGIYQALLAEDGRLGNRVFGGPRIDPTLDTDAQLDVIRGWEARTGLGGEWLRLDAVKIFVDGGIETSADGVDHRFLGPSELGRLVRCAVERGWSVTCHAVSGAAVDLVLDAYADVAGAGGRRCLEHGFRITPEQLARAASLGVWLSTQPAIASVEGALLAASLGPAAMESLCPLATALRLGVRCALGSDWNATPGTDGRPFSPLASVEAAVTRRTMYGQRLGTAEAVDVGTAMYLHTRAPAELVGADDLGGIWPGARADLVALTGDPADGVTGLRVAATVTGGR